MISTLSHFEPNPHYGVGIFRRRIRFRARPGRISAQVDDTHHSFWLTLDHRDQVITGLAGDFIRSPTTVCKGAVAGLSAMIGSQIPTDASDLIRRLPPTSNCTHLVDLALWSMRHLERSIQWDIEIPDQTDRPVWIGISRNQRPVHRWQIADFAITAPPAWQGKPLLKGFLQWARASFDGDALMAAHMLHRGVFVARGRHHIVDRVPSVPLRDAAGMEGMCWAYSEERFATGAHTIGYVRDFTKEIIEEGRAD
ncbi:DUF2889 domain-containing protein [Rhizorhabdus wittichii]|uniref:DUF2889 domain-containing protein n=1 Tax=Rhizorhabdus wittichii TaxID=160791 RepID=A0A975CZ94_9SPHN|nr:DUF2889 domain-containing protein [Rhizorhabdus wittichii]QTH20077.1 DUF2889 domain-containing protein [Rhizorhabdus wittichii]